MQTIDELDQQKLREAVNKDSHEVIMLKMTIAGMRSVLRDCLADYSHPQFTDRHGMADRIRRALAFTD
jgi:hypothetical protein